jgi:hypothetical protein
MKRREKNLGVFFLRKNDLPITPLEANAATRRRSTSRASLRFLCALRALCRSTSSDARARMMLARGKVRAENFCASFEKTLTSIFTIFTFTC